MSAHHRLVLGFGLKIMVPAILAAAGIATVMLYIFNGIFNEANALDKEYTKRAANAALGAILGKIELTTTDNALWDDAVRNAYDPINVKWVEDTWRINTELGIYDVIFIVDGHGKTLIGYEKGKLLSTSAKEFLGSGYDEFVQALPDDGKTFGAVSAIFAGKPWPIAAAAGVIIPATESVTLPQPRPNLLILGKFMNEPLLAEIAKQYVLDDLRLVPPESDVADSVMVWDAKGQAVGKLTWTSRRPGDVARLKFEDGAMALLATLLLVMGVLIYSCWRMFHTNHASELRAHHNALHDELSGLPNRRMLLTTLSEILARPALAGRRLAIVYADLDGFKEVNDAHGHEVGDQLIRAAAAGFAALAQGKGMVARLGGDEFAVIVEGEAAGAAARLLARDMVAMLAEPFDFGGRIASVGTSIGIVEASEDTKDAEELLRRADLAMYSAKAEGRNRTCVYQPAMDHEREERRAIAAALRQAIEAKTLGLVFQPIVDARSRRPVAVEALVRWPAGAGPEVTPDRFIPVAEECGLIEDLGRFVLLQACREAVRWPDLRLSVNVSPLQFRNPGFAREVAQIVALTGLGAGRLELEISESAMVENADKAAATIEKLHGMGITLALDDFGTGYSSIGHLRKFRFDKLKIDRSLVKDILLSPSALRLMQATVAMADALSLEVIAEGVEQEEQVPLLHLAGCRQFQGYLFARPMEAHQIGALLAEPELARVA